MLLRRFDRCISRACSREFPSRYLLAFILIGFLFSVATTTTKQPNIIKADIKRVLDRMQVQYREIKGGFECVHQPSIDLSSVALHPSHGGNHQRNIAITPSQSSSRGDESGHRRSIVRKASKLSFVRKGKDKETSRDKDTEPTRAHVLADREKELPHRPAESIAAMSRSSSFFAPIAEANAETPNTPKLTDVSVDDKPVPEASDVQDSNAEDSHRHTSEGASKSNNTLTIPDQSINNAALSTSSANIPDMSEQGSHNVTSGGDAGPATPEKPKILPPIPRDYAAQPSTPKPAEVDPELFDGEINNPLSVRFEVNIVKVRLHPILVYVHQTNFLSSLGAMASTTWHSVPSSRR